MLEKRKNELNKQKNILENLRKSSYIKGFDVGKKYVLEDGSYIKIEELLTNDRFKNVNRLRKFIKSYVSTYYSSERNEFFLGFYDGVRTTMRRLEFYELTGI